MLLKPLHQHLKTLLPILLASLVALQGCNQTGGGLIRNPASGSGKGDTRTAKIAFANPTYDFDKVDAGTIVKHTYHFANVGEGDLVISEARPSCGCTAPHYPRNPIAPGDSGVIDVEFNTENKAGEQNKTITIISNSDPGAIELALKGFVVNPNETGPIKP